MKRYRKIVMLLTAMALSSSYTFAQVDDVDPLLQYKSKDTDLKFTIGGRMMIDGANYDTQYTPMKSGFALTDARIRTSLTFDKLYFYADFDFSKGEFKQKNIFVRYNICEDGKGIHSLKGGYFAEPSTMAYNTSLYSYHFMNRPGAVNALAPGRALGVTYKFYNKNVLFDQGVFAENKYNNQAAGNQGFSLSGRWLYKPINNSDMVLHVGATVRYAQMDTGFVENDIFKTQQTIESGLQTGVDPTTKFLGATLPWARRNLSLSGEALVMTNKFFARGEYIHKTIYKERPDLEIFNSQLGGIWSWTTLESWQGGNPIRSTKFDGAYLETGYLIFGNKYSYDDEYGLMKGMNDKGSLEVVARYSYTNLNDINDGDFYMIGNGKFYPGGVISDYPPVSTSVAGGKFQTFSVGLNYAINQYVKIMGEYQYGILDNVRFPMDKNFHTYQMRLMFAF